MDSVHKILPNTVDVVACGMGLKLSYLFVLLFLDRITAEKAD